MIMRYLHCFRYSIHNGAYVKHCKTPWIEGESEALISVNLDGESYQSRKIRFEDIPEALNLILPDYYPCAKQ